MPRHSDPVLPKYGRRTWVYFSHKVLRMTIPLLLMLMFAGSALKAGHPFFLVLFVLQALAYATIPLVFAVKGKGRRLLAVQYYLLMNVALVVGYWQYFFSREKYWKKTPRRSRPE